jgi:hypothetical protein
LRTVTTPTFGINSQHQNSSPTEQEGFGSVFQHPSTSHSQFVTQTNQVYNAIKRSHLENELAKNPREVKIVSSGDPPPPAFDARIMKSDENDLFDEKRLLHLVPQKWKNNAKILLNCFDQRGAEFTWNSNGTVFIDQVALPTSNIYEIFPLLFRSKKSTKQIPGLLDVINKLHEMGLSSYILLAPPKRSFDTKKEITNWWYIGP